MGSEMYIGDRQRDECRERVEQALGDAGDPRLDRAERRALDEVERRAAEAPPEEAAAALDAAPAAAGEAPGAAAAPSTPKAGVDGDEDLSLIHI